MSFTCVLRSAVSILTRNCNKPSAQCYQNKYYHILSQITKPLAMTPIYNSLLMPHVPAIVPSCGFKVKGRLRRRCRDCYFVTRDERLYNICPTHPRHKQMSMKKKEKNLWILTHATQGKHREW